MNLDLRGKALFVTCRNERDSLATVVLDAMAADGDQGAHRDCQCAANHTLA